jgi:metal-responsive CopG/Arc/MetJ family transcriptional regulator
MPRLSVRLSDTALHQVEALAAERGCTVSDAIRIAIEQTTAPHTLDTCARDVLHYMTTHTEGMEEIVATMASACHRSVKEMLSYLMYKGVYAIMDDNVLQAG